MTTKPQLPKGRDGALSSLNMAIGALNLAKEATGVTRAKATLGSATNLLIMIRVGPPSNLYRSILVNVCVQDSLVDKADCVELGLTCADACEALSRGMGGRPADQLSPSVFQAIEKLMT